MEEIRSSSADGFSLISIEFETGMNIDDALVKVRERVDAAESELPDDAMDPMIIELSTSDWPILVVNVSGEVGLVALKNAAEQLQERIEGVQGVLEVELIDESWRDRFPAQLSARLKQLIETRDRES